MATKAALDLEDTNLATAFDETGIEEQAPELRATLDFHEIIDPDNENLAELLDANTLNRIGDLWVRINRTDEAVRVFGQIADRYAIDGFFLKAIAIYKKVNKLDPSRLQVYGQLADLYAKQGLAMEARAIALLTVV